MTLRDKLAEAVGNNEKAINLTLAVFKEWLEGEELEKYVHYQWPINQSTSTAAMLGSEEMGEEVAKAIRSTPISEVMYAHEYISESGKLSKAALARVIEMIEKEHKP